MNDVEERLRVALRDALGEPHVPAGLVGAAARHAGRIRRRRVATRGLAGAAAMAGGVVLAANPPAATSRDRVAPLASATATAAEQVVRVTVEHDDCPVGPTAAPGTICVRSVLLVDWPGTPEGPGVLERRLTDTSSEHLNRPNDIAVRLTDGRVLTGEARAAGDGRWVAEVRLPAGADIERISVRNAAGATFVEFAQRDG